MDVQDLIARFRGPLIGFLASLGNDARTSRELAQDTIVQAYLGRDRFRASWTAGSKVGPWLIGIARKLHLENRRARRRETRPLDEVQATSVANDPEQTSDSALLVARAVQGLSLEWREVLTMRYSDENSLAEIAECLGLTTRAVEGRLHRARKELEARLRDLGVQTTPISSHGPSGPRSSS